MNILDLCLNWFSHFASSILILTAAYITLYYLFASQKFCKCSYWDELFNKFRVCLITQKVKISEDTEVVLITGDKDQKGYLCLCEFVKYYNLLVLTRKRVKRLGEDILPYIILLFIASLIYATILLVLGISGQEIKVDQAVIYLTPAAFIAISVFFCFFHIFFARIKISSFVIDKSKKESEMKAKHGMFYSINEHLKMQREDQT